MWELRRVWWFGPFHHAVLEDLPEAAPLILLISFSFISLNTSYPHKFRKLKQCEMKWASARQNLQKGMGAQWRLRSAWASTRSDQSSLSAWRKLGSLATHWAHSEDWSDWADAQANLSLRLAHMPFCWFCHALTQMSVSLIGFSLCFVSAY